jgi:hypothetical protein
MTLQEASAALGERLEVDTINSEGGADCAYIRPRAAPSGISFMVVRDTIERVDVFKGSVQTASGARIGSTEDRIKMLYVGEITVQDHPYTGPEGHYLIYVPRDAADTAFRVIFETDGQVVTMYRAGRRPAVEYIEGCS